MNSLEAYETIYFANAIHPEYQTRPAFDWIRIETNPAVKTMTGRGRVNIHEALNLETFDAPSTEPTTVNGESAVQFLAKIEARYPDKRVIHVIRYNAPYYKESDVRAFLARPECRIHLVPLPSWRPRLNPVERLYVTHNCYYSTTILVFFRETILREWKNFRDRISDDFRVITRENIRFLV